MKQIFTHTFIILALFGCESPTHIDSFAFINANIVDVEQAYSEGTRKLSLESFR